MDRGPRTSPSRDDGEPTRGRVLAPRIDAAAAIAAELEAEGFDDAIEIGRGGFGTVYRCRQPALDRVVAIKVLSAGTVGEDVERFLRESRAMGRLSGHPNIVDVLHADVTSSGRPFIVMPYHSRGSLHQLIAEDGVMAWADTLRVGIKLAGALESAHWIGILHRDLKPANVLMTSYGEPQITDFGIAHVAGAFETASGLVTGSPFFTAPEVAAGAESTESADVYGLGATLFTLLTGHAGYQRKDGETVVGQFLRLHSAPAPMRDFVIPDDISEVVAAAMAVEPRDRPESAAAVGLLLQRCQSRHHLARDQMALPADVTAARPAPPPSPVSAVVRPRPVAPVTGPVAGELTRSPLIDRLGEHRTGLTAIHGPPGAGKSTLAGQFYDHQVVLGRTPLWITAPSDPARFRDVIRTAMIAAHDADPTTPTLVIDDVPRGGVADAALSDAARSVLVIAVGAESSADRTITADDLRLSAFEVHELFQRIYQADISDDAAAKVHRATCGRAAPTVLLAATLGTHSATATAARTSSAAARAALHIQHLDETDALTFLVNNTLNALDRKTSEFLLKISAVDELSVKQAAAFGGPSRYDLLGPAAGGPFLERLRDRPGMFRMRAVYRAIVRSRLDRDHPNWAAPPITAGTD